MAEVCFAATVVTVNLEREREKREREREREFTFDAKARTRYVTCSVSVAPFKRLSKDFAPSDSEGETASHIVSSESDSTCT